MWLLGRAGTWPALEGLRRPWSLGGRVGLRMDWVLFCPKPNTLQNAMHSPARDRTLVSAGSVGRAGLHRSARGRHQQDSPVPRQQKAAVKTCARRESKQKLPRWTQGDECAGYLPAFFSFLYAPCFSPASPSLYLFFSLRLPSPAAAAWQVAAVTSISRLSSVTLCLVHVWHRRGSLVS